MRQAAAGKVLFTLAAALFQRLQWRAVSSFMHTHALLDELDAALASGTDARRVQMLTRIAELFINGLPNYSEDQIALFDHVMGRLLSAIDTKGRTKLAQQLAPIANAPRHVIHTLAFDNDIDVARPVLGQSERISDAEILANATTKSQQHLLAITQRKALSEALTDVLVERGDRRVLHKVVSNRGARFSLAGYGKLTHRARRDRTLTLALGRRSDLPRQYFLKLLETASASVRAKLEESDPHAAAAIRETVDDVATGLQREVRDASRRYSAALRDTNRVFNAQPFTEGVIHARAHAQEFARTVVALAKLGRFPVDVVERALLDKGEDMILVLARAADCSWTTVKELLLMYVAERNLQTEDLARTFERYSKLAPGTARNIVNFYGQRVKQRSQKTRGAGATVTT